MKEQTSGLSNESLKIEPDFSKKKLKQLSHPLPSIKKQS